MEELNIRKSSCNIGEACAIHEDLSVKKLTNNWTKFKTERSSLQDECIFIFSARINESLGLDIKIKKSISTPAKARINVYSMDGFMIENNKLNPWVDDYILFDFIKADSVQSRITIDISVVICLYGFLDEKLIPPPMAPIPIRPGTKYFYLNDFLSDFKIIIGDEVFPVHKFHLAAESNAFLRMFETSMKESRENCVVIEDIEAPVMKEVLKYIYTRETDALNDVDMSMKVLVAAEKYGLDELKGVCETILSKNLNIDNALMILDVADMNNAKQLRKLAIEFLTTNKKEIAQRADFKEFYHRKPELLFDFITMAFEK